MALRDEMQAELKLAMKARDTARMTVLRTTLSAVANAEAVDVSTVARGTTEVARRELTEDDVRAVVASEHADLTAAAEERRSLGADAADLDAQASVLARLLAR